MLREAAPAIVAVLMGVITATFGGVVRDVLCAEAPLILRREISATAATVGAAVYVGLHLAGSGRAAATVAAFVVAFAIRAIGIAVAADLPRDGTRLGRVQSRAARLCGTKEISE